MTLPQLARSPDYPANTHARITHTHAHTQTHHELFSLSANFCWERPIRFVTNDPRYINLNTRTSLHTHTHASTHAHTVCTPAGTLTASCFAMPTFQTRTPSAEHANTHNNAHAYSHTYTSRTHTCCFDGVIGKCSTPLSQTPHHTRALSKR